MKHLKTLLVTANVGSLFDDPENLFPIWLKTFYQTVRDKDPDFIAVHCQEVGGKNFEESMPNVKQWIKELQTSSTLKSFDKIRVFLDEDYATASTFTALGSLYFIHSRVTDVKIWDFKQLDFSEVTDVKIFGESIESVGEKDKQKFPIEYFPNQVWSRKGYMRTRWRIGDGQSFDLVNIHLFHDADNLECMQKAPSVYADYRKAAFVWTLSQLANVSEDAILFNGKTAATDVSELSQPTFVFGDFNFRLDFKDYAKNLTENTEVSEQKDKKNQVAYLSFQNSNGTILKVGKKFFDRFASSNEFFENKNSWLNKFDKELQEYNRHLFEFPLSFPPTYPFSENVSDPDSGTEYMKTRLPSWCDRVLCSQSTRKILLCPPEQPTHYGVIALHQCVGDHKPVYLFTLLQVGDSADGDHQVLNPNCASAAAELPAPPLLQQLHLLDQPGVQVKLTEKDGAVYVHVRRDGATICVFRETAV